MLESTLTPWSSPVPCDHHGRGAPTKKGILPNISKSLHSSSSVWRGSRQWLAACWWGEECSPRAVSLLLSSKVFASLVVLSRDPQCGCWGASQMCPSSSLGSLRGSRWLTLLSVFLVWFKWFFGGERLFSQPTMKSQKENEIIMTQQRGADSTSSPRKATERHWALRVLSLPTSPLVLLWFMVQSPHSGFS